MSVLYTLLAAYAAGWLLNRLRMPGGMMVGAVIGAAAFGILLGQAELPPITKVVAQVVAGAFIGSGVRREDMRQMRALLKVAVILIGCLLVVNLVSGIIIWRISSMDLLTAFMASVPGGLSDIPIIAVDMGADASQVLALQMVRFMMGIGLFPSLIALLPEDDRTTTHETVTYAQPDSDWPNTLLTLMVAAVFGVLGSISSVPGGTMAFSAIGSIGFKLLYPKACLKSPVRIAAQCLSGAYVGASIGTSQLMEMKQLLWPAVVLLACYMLGTVLISALLRHMGVFRLRESLLAATPAGASDMALISADLGVQNVNLILLQVMRLVVVITLFPTLLYVIAGWIAP